MHKYIRFETTNEFLHGHLFVRDDMVDLVRHNLTTLQVSWKEHHEICLCDFHHDGYDPLSPGS